MARGPKPMSDELKEARGNPGKRPIGKKAQAKKVASKSVSTSASASKVSIERPAWLTDTLAKRIFEDLRQTSPFNSFLRSSDINVFSRYCTYMADWIKATKNLNKLKSPVYETDSNHGKMLRIHPLSVVRTRLELNLERLESVLGLSPADRQSIVKQMAAAAGLGSGDLFGRNDPDPGDAEKPGKTRSNEDVPKIAGENRPSVIGGLSSAGKRLN